MLQCDNWHSSLGRLSMKLDVGSPLAPSQRVPEFSNHSTPASAPLTPTLPILVCVGFCSYHTRHSRRGTTHLDNKVTVPTSEGRNDSIGESKKWFGHAPQDTHDVPHTTASDITLFQSHLQSDPALGSPTTCLPTEVLAYIFELSLSDEGNSTPGFGPTRSPCHLVQVCKLWRAIAESDPHLWTSIHVYFPVACQSRAQDVQSVKHMFDLHLKQSGTLPISLTFTDYRFYRAVTEPLVSLLVDRLRTHSCRWRHISLHLSCGYFPLLFTFMPCDLSSLEYLHISGDVLGQRTVTTLRLNLESAKKLKSFSYSGPGHAVNDKIDLNWEQLTDLSFEFAPHAGVSSTLSRHLRRLAQCRNITTCSLGIDRPFWSDLDDGQTITLPCLHTLHVRRLSLRSHARTVIDPLVLPRLHTLEIDAAPFLDLDAECPSWHNHNFSNLLARSGCALRHLLIHDVDFPNDELVRCLALSHALASLRFIPHPPSQDITDVIRALDASPVTLLGDPRRETAQVQVQGQRRNEQKYIVGSPLVPGLREITLASSVEGCMDLIMGMCRTRGGRAPAAEVAVLRRVEAVLFDMPHVSAVALPGNRLLKVVNLQKEMAQ